MAQSLPLSQLEKMAANLLNAKKPREALPCLEHLVSARPDEKRYRMGLTVALEAIGENDRARHHLEKLRGAKLAAKERDVVNQRLQALSQAKTWSGYLRFGITPETNLGKVAGTQEIVINGIPFTYHPTQKAEPKVRLHIETGLEYLPHLNRDTRLRLALSLDSKISDDKTYRDNRVQLDLGLRHYGDRQRQAEFGLRLAIRTLADKTYSDQTGLYAQFSQQISRKGTFRAKLETYRLAHESFTAADGRRNLAAAMGGVKSIAMVTGLGAAFTVRDIPQSAKERLAFAVARRLYRWASSLNSKLIFQNPDDLRDFIDTGCLRDPGKAALVDGSGVDLSHFAPEPPVHKPIFLMIARLLRNKGVLEYAAAAEILRARYPDSCFRLVGPLDPGIDGINNANLESWVADGTIEYIGKVDDVRPQLAEAMVYVLPSYREGTPRSVLEAMSMGRAIVTSDAPGCRETIRDGVEGYLVPVGDSQALAAAMERFLRDPELATTMGAKSHERARTKYDVRRINRVMIELLTGSPQQR